MKLVAFGRKSFVQSLDESSSKSLFSSSEVVISNSESK